jgi:hypothetical protein
MGNFFFFFFFLHMGGENKWGEIYTSLLAMQVCFAHLLRSQGDKRDYPTKNEPQQQGISCLETERELG